MEICLVECHSCHVSVQQFCGHCMVNGFLIVECDDSWHSKGIRSLLSHTSPARYLLYTWNETSLRVLTLELASSVCNETFLLDHSLNYILHAYDIICSSLSVALMYFQRHFSKTKFQLVIKSGYAKTHCKCFDLINKGFFQSLFVFKLGKKTLCVFQSIFLNWKKNIEKEKGKTQ